jgi:hypothetical protein
VDEEIYIGGSYNPTQNATSNNEEHVVLIYIYDEDVCRKVDKWFEKLWMQSRLVTTSEIDEMTEKLEQLQKEKAAKKEKEKEVAMPKSQPKRRGRKVSHPLGDLVPEVAAGSAGIWAQ